MCVCVCVCVCPGMRVAVLLAVLLAAARVGGYSRGAPDLACSNMFPRHGPNAQTSAAPFSVSPIQVRFSRRSFVCTRRQPFLVREIRRENPVAPCDPLVDRLHPSPTPSVGRVRDSAGETLLATPSLAFHWRSMTSTSAGGACAADALLVARTRMPLDHSVAGWETENEKEKKRGIVGKLSLEIAHPQTSVEPGGVVTIRLQSSNIGVSFKGALSFFFCRRPQTSDLSADARRFPGAGRQSGRASLIGHRQFPDAAGQFANLHLFAGLPGTERKRNTSREGRST